MLEKTTGKLLHIDFGDCFEVAMQREKFPEKIPFRLTRMLVAAMEVSGIEGTFRCTADSVMRVLRENKESVMAVLEAFVYDPLINWRLLATNKQTMHGDEVTNATAAGAAAAAATDVAAAAAAGATNGAATQPAGATPNGAAAATAAATASGSAGASSAGAGDNPTNVTGAAAGAAGANPITSASGSGSGGGGAGAGHLPLAMGGEEPPLDSDSSSNEVLNAKAVAVIARVEAKLQGRDFDHTCVLDTSEQVEKLIQQATSHTNLCLCYIGWCPFW